MVMFFNGLAYTTNVLYCTLMGIITKALLLFVQQYKEACDRYLARSVGDAMICSNGDEIETGSCKSRTLH